MAPILRPCSFWWNYKSLAAGMEGMLDVWSHFASWLFQYLPSFIAFSPHFSQNGSSTISSRASSYGLYLLFSQPPSNFPSSCNFVLYPCILQGLISQSDLSLGCLSFALFSMHFVKRKRKKSIVVHWYPSVLGISSATSAHLWVFGMGGCLVIVSRGS